MIAFVLTMVSKLVEWLSGILPASPFSGLTLALGGVADAIGWLNWVVPVGQMATIYAAWLVGAAVWQVAQFVMSRFDSGLSLFGAK